MNFTGSNLMLLSLVHRRIQKIQLTAHYLRSVCVDALGVNAGRSDQVHSHATFTEAALPFQGPQGDRKCWLGKKVGDHTSTSAQLSSMPRI